MVENQSHPTEKDVDEAVQKIINSLSDNAIKFLNQKKTELGFKTYRETILYLLNKLKVASGAETNEELAKFIKNIINENTH